MSSRHSGDEPSVVDGWDRVFEALSSAPRRQIIYSLLDASPGATVSLPESASNPNVAVDPESLRTQLRHCHLPKLAEMNFVDWETGPWVASRGSNFDDVAVVIHALQSNAVQIPDHLAVGCRRLEQERDDS